MLLSSLNIGDFRNFSQTQLEFDDKCNIFYGENGSGKTTILEAIYYLILGRSFRSHILRRIIKYDSNSFSLFGKIRQDNRTIPVGITKSTEASKHIKIAGKEVSSNIEITKLAPLQLLNHNSYFLLYEGPKIRRQFIDWGLFHVEQSFLDLWRKVERILGQRNIALRKKSPADHIRAWDKELARLGLELHNYRNQYINNLLPIAKTILQTLLGNFSINISYLPGWDVSTNLELFLTNNLKTDLQFGYTTAGPHRADLKILINNVPAKDTLSRGQQKLLLYGLQVAQGELLNQLTGKRCIYLVDDLLAELDMQKCCLLAKVLLDLEETQIFVTGLNPGDLETVFGNHSNSKKTLHVNNGTIEN
ncbi:MAG: DNA replication/repair protein RecF [Gammaproteobacteria bacterium]|nr:DNA replication/repair protein RecF [Gammaproteobacteria bacterium]